MKDMIVFFAGVAVRLVGVIAEHYAAWLLRRIGDGRTFGMVADLKAFLHGLLTWAAERLSGHRYLTDCEDWHRGFDF